jgi:hypothetical protein
MNDCSQSLLLYTRQYSTLSSTQHPPPFHPQDVELSILSTAKVCNKTGH